MAAEAFQKLDEQLNCAICLDTYTDPRLLRCHHVYCRRCLVKLAVRDQQGQLSLNCPTCRKVTLVPDNDGVAGLQSAFNINHLLEIRESFKKVLPSGEKVEVSDGKVATASTPAERIVSYKCPEHTDKELELYCEVCEEVICLKCVVKGSRHQGHACVTFDTAFDKYKGEIALSLEPIKKQLTDINSALAQLDGRCQEISNQRTAVEAEVQSTFRQLHEALDARKTELICHLNQFTQNKLKNLAAQRDQMETTQAQLTSCLDFLRENLSRQNQGEVLMMKSILVEQVRKLATTYSQPDTLKPNTKADITFSLASDISALCRNYGEITLQTLAPSKCYIINDEDIKVATVEEEVTALLQAVSSENKPCDVPIKSLECKLVSDLTGAIVKGCVKRRGTNQYEISYLPIVKGRHRLSIKVEGHHIRGSPFTDLQALLPVERMGTGIKSIFVGGPNLRGMTVGLNGEIIITERTRDCVSICNLSGEELLSFGTHGSGPGQFMCPHAVAVDVEGNILVADQDNHRIQMFTAQGQFRTAIRLRQKQYPYGIASNATNRKAYVTVQSQENDYILVLNPNLTLFNTFGKRGSDRGQLNDPHHIACDSTGNVYVADSGNGCIQVFTAEGKFLSAFREAGEEALIYPVNIAIDVKNRVYIYDITERCICEGPKLKSNNPRILPFRENCVLNLLLDNLLRVKMVRQGEATNLHSMATR